MRKLARVCAAFSLAVFAAHYVLPESAAIYAAAMCAAAGLLLRRAGVRRGVGLFSAFLAAALGFLCCFIQNETTIKRMEALSGSTREVGAVAEDFPAGGDGCVSMYVSLREDGLPGRTVRVFDYDGLLPENIAPGDGLSLTLRFKSARLRYGEESDYYNSRNVFAAAYTDGSCLKTGRSVWYRYLPKYAARWVKNAVDGAFPDDASPFVKALLTGDRTDFYADGQLSAAMRTSGLIHVVAVSGLHVSFLIGFLLLMLGRSRRSSVLCLGLVWFFVVMTGAGPSTVRAGFMQSMLLLAPLFGRENDGPTSLALPLAVILLLNPSEAGSAALQMSFGAMAGIMLFTPSIYARLVPPDGRRAASRPRRYVCGVLASSLGATAFTFPILAVRFGYVPLLGPIANILCLWAVTLCFCGGFVVCAAWALLPAAGAAGAWLVSWLVRYIAAVCGIISSVPYAAVYMTNGLAAVWLALAYAVFIITWLGRDRDKKYRWGVPAAISALTLAAALIAVSAVYSSGAGYFTALDVGQGQCLAVMAGRDTVVIDCGGSGADGGAGEKAAAYLLGCGRRSVDALILTHLHADHACGAVRLMQMIKVKTLIIPADAPDDDLCLPQILAQAERGGTQVRYIREDSVCLFGPISARLYAPVEAGTANERCMSVAASVGSFDMLVTGDMSRTAEKALLCGHDLAGTELLIVGHHGSKYSASAELLEATGAKTAIISVGFNSYGHPSGEALRRLWEAGAKVYRTDLNGNVTVRTG